MLFPRSSKGQLTAFIILGVLLVLLVGLGLYVMNQRASQTIEQNIPAMQEVPGAVRSVQEFVQSCIQRVGEDAIKQLGDHGGYVSSDGFSPRVIPNAPTESDGVVFSPGSDLIVPYWWHLKSANDCTTCQFATKQPYLSRTQGSPNMEEQLDQYMTKELPACFADFASLAPFTITPQTSRGTLQVTSSITPTGVVFYVTYPLVARVGRIGRIGGEGGASSVGSETGEEYALSDFAAVVPVRLQELYELAKEITALQAQYRFLEKDTKNLLTAYSRMDEEALPPFTGVEFGLGTGKIWVKNDVQQKVMSILAAYIPVLQVWGTKNYQWIAAKTNEKNPALYELVYNRQQLIPIQTPHPRISASMSYLDWWKPYFDMNCQGQVCKGESMINTYGFTFGMQKYAFSYEISYPVVVELKDADAFQGRGGGLTFRFALESNLRANEPLQNKLERPHTLGVLGGVLGLAGAAGSVEGASITAGTAGTTGTVAGTTTNSGTLLCAVGQRTSAPVTLSVTNARTNRPIDADVTFSCGTETCTLGYISSEITTALPVCFGGVLTVFSQGFAPTATPVSTSLDSPKTINLALEPSKAVNISVKKYLLKKNPAANTDALSSGAWFVDTSGPAPHGANDQTIISLQRRTQGFEQSFSAVAEVYGDSFSTEKDFAENIQLYPGTYDVSITTLSYDALTIPKQKRCYAMGLGKQQCVDVPNKPLVFGPQKPFAAGGATLTWTIMGEELEKARTITFNTIYQAESMLAEHERTLEDLEQTSKISEYSQAYATVLRPVIT